MVRIWNGLARFLASQGQDDFLQDVSWLRRNLTFFRARLHYQNRLYGECGLGLLGDPKFRWFDCNSEFLVDHFDIIRSYGILTGEISIDHRDARVVTFEQLSFVMH